MTHSLRGHSDYSQRGRERILTMEYLVESLEAVRDSFKNKESELRLRERSDASSDFWENESSEPWNKDKHWADGVR